MANFSFDSDSVVLHLNSFRPFFRKRVPNFLGVVLACVIGAFIGILATYLILKFLLWVEVIGSVNTDWFIRQCIWLAVLAIFGVILSGKAFKNKPEK